MLSRLPAFLLIPARSRVETESRYGSFCDSGCGLAAQHTTTLECVLLGGAHDLAEA
jgi:hypothetical protein